MWRAEPGRRRRRVLLAYLGATHIAWCAVERRAIVPGSYRCEQLSLQHEGELGARLVQLMSSPDTSCALVGARVVVADSWLGCAQLPWRPLLRAAAIEAYARNRLQQAGHVASDDDMVVVENGPGGRARMAFCYPQPLMAALQHWAGQLHLPLCSVLPSSVAAWNAAAALRGNHGVALMDDSMLAFGYGPGGRARHLEQVILRVGNTLQELAQFHQRLALRDPALAPLEQMALFDLRPQQQGGLRQLATARALSGPMLGGLDGLARQARHAGSRPLFAVAVAAGMVASLLAGTALQYRLAVDQVEAQLETRRSVVAAVAPSSRSRQELARVTARVTAINGAIRQLNVPLDSWLAALTPPSDIHIGLLDLDARLDAAAAPPMSLRLVAVAASVADMTRYLAYLNQHDIFASARLLRHEHDTRDAGALQYPWRFTVELAWRASH